MALIGNLLVEIRATVDKFNADMKSAQKEVGAFQKAYAPSIELFKMAAAGAIAAGAAVVTGLAAATKIAADYNETIRDASIRTGITTETLSALKVQAEQSGSSLSDMTTGLRFLAKNMVEAVENAGDQRDAFDKVGISVDDLRNANGQLEPVLRKVMDSFQKLPDGAEKSALSMQLFGRNGVAVTEVLNGGSQALDRYTRLTQIFGTDVSKDAGDAADAFGDALNNLKQATLGVSLEVGNRLIPALTEAISWITATTVVSREGGAALLDMGSVIAEHFTGSTLGDYFKFAATGILAASPELTIFLGEVIKTKAEIDSLTAFMKPFEKAASDAADQMKASAKATEDWRKHSEKLRDLGFKGAIEQARRLEDVTEDRVKREIQHEAAAMKEYFANIQARLKAELDRIDKEIAAELAWLDANTRANEQALQNRISLSRETERIALDDLRAAEDGFNKKQKAAEDATKAIVRENQKAVDDMKRSAGKIFDDMFLKGESVFSGLKNALKGGALSLGRSIFEDIVGHLFGPIKKAMDEFFGSIFAGIGRKMGDAVSGALGLGASAVPTATKGTSGAAGLAGLTLGPTALATMGAGLGVGLVLSALPSTPGGHHLPDFWRDSDLNRRFKALNAAGFNDEFESFSAQNPNSSARAIIEMTEALRRGGGQTNNIVVNAAPGMSVDEVVNGVIRKLREEYGMDLNFSFA